MGRVVEGKLGGEGEGEVVGEDGKVGNRKRKEGARERKVRMPDLRVLIWIERLPKLRVSVWIYLCCLHPLISMSLHRSIDP
jgi:hypothetical protein